MTSYVKLFGSILDSTVWDLPPTTRLVWITMLAMKDADGIVESSIPGLARRARVSIDETEAALKTLSSPDKYSTTPDHEGRRIAKVDGGWRVLNHDKYRDKENAAARREKKAKRQKRWRDNARERGNANLEGDVDAETSTQRLRETPVDGERREETSVDARSPHTDTDTDLPDTRVPDLDPSRSEAPPVERRLEREQQAPRHRSDVQPPSDEVVRANYKRIGRFVELVNAARQKAGTKHNVALKMLTGAIVGRQGTELLERLRASSTPDDDLEHVVAVAEHEALADPDKLQWLGWSIVEEKSWRTKLLAPRPGRKAPKPAPAPAPAESPMTDDDRAEIRGAIGEFLRGRR